MTGKLKTKGNMMFATKLDGVLKVRRPYFRCSATLTCLSLQATKTKAKL